MDLRNFIKEALVQIALGIDDASEALGESNAIVNPRNVATGGGTKDSKIYGFMVADSNPMQQIVQSVDFDVAVSVAQGSQTKGGVGLMVGAIALGSQGKSDSSNASQSRIQFSVPMLLPTRK